MTYDKEELWNNFWQEMHERGGISDLMSAVHLDLTDVMEGESKEDIHTHYYWNIQPLDCADKAKEKIIKHYGGNKGLVEFMAYNADWEDWRKVWEKEYE